MLNIDMEFKQGILIVRLKGILNGDTSYILKDNLEMVIRDNGIKYVLLNLKKLDYIDKYGIEVMKKSYDEVVANNGKLIICGMEKILNYNTNLTEHLYQINEEPAVYDLVNLW